jgi:hypothetical protein
MTDDLKKRYGDPYEFTHPVNPQTGERTQTRSLWGFGGWYSNAIDVALRNDDAEAFIYFVRESGLDKEFVTLDGSSAEQICNRRNAVKCKKAIAEQLKVPA